MRHARDEPSRLGAPAFRRNASRLFRSRACGGVGRVRREKGKAGGSEVQRWRLHLRGGPEAALCSRRGVSPLPPSPLQRRPKVKVSPVYKPELRQDGKAIAARQDASGQGHPRTAALAGLPRPHPKLLRPDPSPPFPSRKRKGWQVGRWVGRQRAKPPFYLPAEQTDQVSDCSRAPEPPEGAARRAPGFYLSHQPVRARVLLILEYDVGVVIGGELLEPLGVS